MWTIFIHKILQSFFLPPLNGLLVIIIGLVLIAINKRKRKIGIFISVIGILFIYFQATPFIAYKLSALVEPKPILKSELDQAGAIVVLGGGVNNSSKEYNKAAISNLDTLGRIRYSAYLAKQYPKMLVIVSGGAVNLRDSEAGLIKDALEKEFNISNKIIVEDGSINTAENAKNVARILLAKNINSAAVVTQAWHTRRAVALLRQNGIDAYAAPTTFYSLSYYNMPLLWFIPTAGAMSQTSSVIRELLGYCFDVES